MELTLSPAVARNTLHLALTTGVICVIPEAVANAYRVTGAA